MGMFRDRYAEQKRREHEARRVERMRPPKVTSRHHPQSSTKGPRQTCGRRCGHPSANPGCVSAFCSPDPCPCRYC
jgi:hypothetical protein